MQDFSVLRTANVIFLSLLLAFPLGFLAGLRGVDDVRPTVTYNGLIGKVEVYRDQNNIPAILADNVEDMLYAQGYEFARDRLFQLEFYRSIINGELSRLFGRATIEADMFLRTIGLKRAAIRETKQADQNLVNLVSAYVQGINDFIDSHLNNLPLEFQLLGVNPKHWTVEDSFGVHGILSYNFAFGGLWNEIVRYEVIKKVGTEKSLELLPVQFEPAKEYIRNYDESIDIFGSGTLQLAQKENEDTILGYNIPDFLKDILMPKLPKFASNNWVISGAKTKYGKPILANDPHLGLSVPGLWYFVTLIARKDNIHLQGYTIPGLPFIGLGHNQYMAWGATAAIADSVDTFYLKTNGEKYLVNKTIWKDFKYEKHQIPVNGQNPIDFTVKLTDFGPMINVTINGKEGQLALKWTFLEDDPRNQPFKGIYSFIRAKSVDEFHEALKYLTVPGFNWVFADTDGNIGLQLNAQVPIRTQGYGLLPQNGSSGKSFWNGSIPYEMQYYVKNPPQNFLYSANERVDKRNQFYYSETFALGYRARRISQVIENGTDFFGDKDNWDLHMTQKLQADVKNLVAEDLLDPIIQDLSNLDFNGFENAGYLRRAVRLLEKWDKRMGVNSVEGLIFTTFTLFFVKATFEDELGWEMTRKMQYPSIGAIARFLNQKQNLNWFDNINTAKNESVIDTAVEALKQSISYLINSFGSEMDSWKWGRAHIMRFEHPMSSVLPFLDIGNEGMNGTSLTINALEGPWFRADGTIRYNFAYGPSMHFTVVVENKWGNIEINYPPGVSGNIGSKNYDNLYEMWRDFKYFSPPFNEEDIRNNYSLEVVYTK